MSVPWFLLALAIGAVGTWLARRYALRHALLDAPGERRAHTVPTPRGGGIGIVVALLVVGIAWLPTLAEPVPFVLALVGMTLVAAAGLLDDHRPLSPWGRLCVHAAAAGLLALGAWLQAHDVVLAIVAFVLAMGLTNVWNFMDGIDGIAATQAVLVALAIAFGSASGWSWWALALVAATLGFLPFNFPKARVFLGDVGSGAIGFALAALFVQVLATIPVREWAIWALPPSAFLMDASLTLSGRMLRGERWWTPHDLHAYQRWARVAGSHVRVTFAYAAWTMASIALLFALRGRALPPEGVLAVVGAWYIGGTGIWLLLQGPQRQGKGVPR